MATRITDAGRVQLIAPGSSPMRPAEYRGVDYRGYTAEAQAAGALGDVISRMSSFAAKLGERAVGQQAQEDYFAKFQVTAADIRNAKDGDPDNLLIGNDATIYGRTLKKMRAMQLSGMFETEIKSLAATLKTDAENGLPTADVASKLEAAIAANVDILSKQDPEAAVKLYAASKGYASTAVNAAYEYEVKRKKERAAAAVTLANQQENPDLIALTNAGISSDREGAVNNIDYLDTRRVLRAQQAFAVDGKTFMESEIKATDTVILAGAKQWVAQAISKSGNFMDTYDDIVNGTTDNAVINAIITGTNAINGKAAPAWATAMAPQLLAAAKEAYQGQVTFEDNRQKFYTRTAEGFEADFVIAEANGDVDGMRVALDALKPLDRKKHSESLLRFMQYQQGGSTFARYDHQGTVEHLNELFLSPYGDSVVTYKTVSGFKHLLTKETYNKFLNQIKTFDNDQVRLLKEELKTRLKIDVPIMAGDLRSMLDNKAVQSYNRILGSYISYRRQTPPELQVSGLAWLDTKVDGGKTNFELGQEKAAADKTADDRRAFQSDKWANYRTIPDIDKKINELQASTDSKSIRQRNELMEWRKTLQRLIKDDQVKDGEWIGGN